MAKQDYEIKTPDYTIDHNDKQFTDIKGSEQQALNENQQMYGEMIGQTDSYYKDQIEATKQWEEAQTKIQNENTAFTIEQIEQQKAQANKDYQKEQSGAYVDWQKQSNKYGVNAENMASAGLTQTGFSESSQVSMYNTYQNRVATARESYNLAVMNYNNSIKDAQLQNNSKLAEIAFNSLKTQLELSLQGFQYKNQLLTEQANKKLEIENAYHNRYMDVWNQMNQQNALAEEVRQYNENMTFQREEALREQANWQKEYEFKMDEFNEQIKQFDREMARLEAQDKADNEYKIEQLKLQKEQLRQEQENWEKEYALKEKEVNASLSSGSGGSKTPTINKGTGGNESDEEPNTFGNSPETMKKKDYYFSNGYQPQYINNKKLSKTGSTVKDVFGSSLSGISGTQNIWFAGGRFYVWDGSNKVYIDVTNKASNIFESSATNKVNEKAKNLFLKQAEKR